MFNAFRLAILVTIICLTFGSISRADQADKDSNATSRRPAWTTSRVKGTPEPPLPYRAQRVFPNLGFEQPTVLTSAPGTDRLFVAEQKGRIYSIPNDRECREADLFVDINDLVEHLNSKLPEKDHVRPGPVYGLTFHPDFADNRHCYICYIVNRKSRGDSEFNGTRVVRVTVDDADPPKVILDSETEIISWLAGGHNGGCLKFGKDGMLYISTGDGGNAFPPDGRTSGQDVTNLLAGVLRIDVNQPANGRAYSVPQDNPFVGVSATKLELPEGTRSEIWAYGMRNPWKMSIDRKTGDLWVGDVGWELWELVYRVKPGDNFGWSIVEGRQPVRPEQKPGPTPVVSPTVEIPHTEAASITGGFVYRGPRFPELHGQYILAIGKHAAFGASQSTVTRLDHDVS